MKIIAVIAISILISACSFNKSINPENSVTTKASLQSLADETPNNDVQEQLKPLDFVDKMSRHETNKYWQLDKRLWLDIPYLVVKLGTAGCVSIEFTITQDGKAQKSEIIYSYPEGVFDKAAIKAISKRRWSATAVNQSKRPVKTSTVFVVGADREIIKQYCQYI
jgi:TonB family protein